MTPSLGQSPPPPMLPPQPPSWMLCLDTSWGSHLLGPAPHSPQAPCVPSHRPSTCVAAVLARSATTRAQVTTHRPCPLATTWGTWPPTSSDHPSPLWSHMGRPAESNCPGLCASGGKHLLGLGSPPAHYREVKPLAPAPTPFPCGPPPLAKVCEVPTHGVPRTRASVQRTRR